MLFILTRKKTPNQTKQKTRPQDIERKITKSNEMLREGQKERKARKKTKT